MNSELRAFAHSNKKSQFCYPFVTQTTQNQLFHADNQIVIQFTIVSWNFLEINDRRIKKMNDNETN